MAADGAFAALPDDCVMRVVAQLRLDEALRCGALCTRLCALVRQPRWWACLRLEGVDAAKLDDAALAKLLVMAGVSLRSLDVTGALSGAFTGSGVSAALESCGAAHLEALTCGPGGVWLEPAHLARVRAACPRLRAGALALAATPADLPAALEALPEGTALSALRVLPAGATAAAWAACTGAVVAALRGPALQELVFQSQELWHSGAELQGALFAALGASRSLRELHAQNSYLGPAFGATLAAAALGGSVPLTRLDMGMNNLQADGCQVLAQALAHHRTLMALHLHFNALGDEGACYLARVLPTTQLRELHLGDNGIDARGCAELATAVARHATLRMLMLVDNHFGDPGCLALAQALEGNDTMRELHVRGCLFTRRGWDALRRHAAVVPLTPAQEAALPSGDDEEDGEEHDDEDDDEDDWDDAEGW